MVNGYARGSRGERVRSVHDLVSRVGHAAVCESGRPAVLVARVRLLIRRSRKRDARGDPRLCPPALTIVPSGAAKCIGRSKLISGV
jgi:hypothetical protein